MHLAQVLVEAIRGPKMAQTFSASRRMGDPVTIVAIVRVGRERETHAKAPSPAVLAAHAFAGRVDGMGSCGSTQMRNRACGPALAMYSYIGADGREPPEFTAAMR